MRGGGFNAENTQVSDGRRAPLRKCNRCGNAIRAKRAQLCTDCNQRAFEARQKSNRTRTAKRHIVKATMPFNALSQSLSGLQRFWLSDLGDIA